METRFLEEERDVFVKQRVFLDDFVLPDYDILSIRNIKALVGKIYGVNSLQTASFPDGFVDDFDGVQKVFLVVMDGFGYNRLLKHVKQYDGAFSELIAKGVLKPLTSPFPATTSTSLTSIFTGLTPSEHGVIGYQMFSRDYGCVFNTLDMKPVYGYSSEVEIASDLSRKIKPWLPALQEHGIRTLIATKSSIMGSGLSKVIHANQDVTPYMLESEMLVKCRRALEQRGPVFLVLYYSGIDTLEHKYGPNSEEVTSEIQSFEFLLKSFFNKISDATKKETLIMLTADHGVCETQKTHYVKDYPEVVNRLQLPPVGDSRCGFLFSKQSEKENLKSALEKSLDGFKLVASKDMLESGAFGQTTDYSSLQSAVGDFAALSKGPKALSYPYYEDDRNREQHGGHGGMTAEEVVVPMLSVRLSKT
ncbi:MAG TPA: alkaline phosphatase family protein [Candidatus Bathyarchaeia archaeon]|nr:alkaline phosphatase family protein [Candidatus Bathyarchaeia archaeon]